MNTETGNRPNNLGLSSTQLSRRRSGPNAPNAQPPIQILIVDDEPHILEICARVAAELGFQYVTAATGGQAAGLVDERSFDIVLTDIRMPGCDGFEVFRRVKAKSPRTVVAMMTGYGDIDQAVAALRSGVLDYITKPFDGDQLANRLRPLAKWRMRHISDGSSRGGDVPGLFHGIVGRSARMQDVFDRIERASSVDSPVLIQGETGTGKELVARAIHAHGARAEGPFLPLDCAALSEGLAEAELFGHVKGAFTGALEATPGVFRAADGGTVFMDEIGELPASMQPKFLRTLQEKEVRPVGGVKPEPFDARIITATNRDLQKDAATGDFRRDLFYRLHVIPIHVPPLRERSQDIPLLVDVFIARHSGLGEAPIQIAPEAMEALSDYDWPGNVRELENCVEQACVLRNGPVIALDDLPPALRPGGKAARRAGENGGLQIKPLAAREYEAVRDALQRTGGNKTAAAKALGISVPTLYAKIRKYDIDVNGAG